MGPRVGALKVELLCWSAGWRLIQVKAFWNLTPSTILKHHLASTWERLKKIVFTLDGQIRDESYRTVEYLERRGSGKEMEGWKRKKRGAIDFEVQDVLSFDESGHQQQRLNISMSFNFYTQFVSRSNMLLENKINLLEERKRLSKSVKVICVFFICF